MISEAGVTWLSVVDSEGSRDTVVLLRLGCEVVLGPKLVSATFVVSTNTGLLSDTELVAEKGRVPESVEDGGEGEVPSAEGMEMVAVLVSATEGGFICDTLSEGTLVWTVVIFDGVSP